MDVPVPAPRDMADIRIMIGQGVAYLTRFKGYFYFWNKKRKKQE